MKTAVLKNQHYELDFNQDFLEFSSHYNTVIIPCEPYSPEQKGKVESGIKYLEMNFISGRTFTDSTDLKRQLRDWMDNHANQRIHGTTKRVPFELYFRRGESEAATTAGNSLCLFQPGCPQGRSQLPYPF